MPANRKILFVRTSQQRKEKGYLLELDDPWKVLTDAGFEIDFVSPKGGESAVDYFDLKDESSKEFR